MKSLACAHIKTVVEGTEVACRLLELHEAIIGLRKIQGNKVGNHSRKKCVLEVLDGKERRRFFNHKKAACDRCAKGDANPYRSTSSEEVPPLARLARKLQLLRQDAVGELLEEPRRVVR